MSNVEHEGVLDEVMEHVAWRLEVGVVSNPPTLVERHHPRTGVGEPTGGSHRYSITPAAPWS
jgi:hypothetical protein